MASLVKGVYRMDNYRAKWPWKDAKHEKIETMPQLWTTFRYKIHKRITDGDRIFGAVYHSLLDRQDHPEDYKDPSAPPQIVVALRGTVLSKLDVEADIDILFHHLPAHKRFRTVLQEIRDLVSCFGAGSVCLTGHSKGAALAVLVGRKLAEEGCYLEARLFNPPNPSLPFKFFHIQTEVTLAVGVAHNIAANTLAHVLQGENTRNHDREAFLSACKWMPNLYINEHDPICSSYIDYFEVNEQLPKLKEEWFGRAISSIPHSIRGIVRSSAGMPDCRPVHLIPSASLYIKKEASSSSSAHKLDEWLDLHLEICPVHFNGESHE